MSIGPHEDGEEFNALSGRGNRIERAATNLNSNQKIMMQSAFESPISRGNHLPSEELKDESFNLRSDESDLDNEGGEEEEEFKDIISPGYGPSSPLQFYPKDEDSINESINGPHAQFPTVDVKDVHTELLPRIQADMERYISDSDYSDNSSYTSSDTEDDELIQTKLKMESHLGKPMRMFQVVEEDENRMLRAHTAKINLI